MSNSTVAPAKDTVFREVKRAADFTFDARVSSVFDDMVSRSVPHYSELQHMLADLAAEFLPEDGGVVCDLGCSTGTTIDLLANHPRTPQGTRFVGIDNSPHMLEQARAKLVSIAAAGRLELIEADLNGGIDIPPCNIIFMNWTLQFVRPLHRESLLRQIAQRLSPPGALLLSEKVLVSDSFLNRAYIEQYLRYKKRQGYSDEEIQRKREALENVLIPYRVEENMEMLRRCGFATVDMFFRWFNFASFIAIRSA
jgi:tRNA (cmo5U34)-methyltransferase